MASPLARQIWTVSGVFTNMLVQGMVLSFPSCLLPGLRETDSPIKADLATASWLASSVGLSSMLGFLISSYLMDRCGRRISHLLVILPGISAWLFIYFAHNVLTLMLGRILAGITAGATVTLGAIVIGEYTSPEYRGMFLNLKSASVCLGNMVVHILHNFFNWKTIAIFGLIPQIFAFLIIYTWPESPAWLASKGQFQKAKETFFWLRGSSEREKLELSELFKKQEASLLKFGVESTLMNSLKVILKKFTRKDFIKPITIIVFTGILSEACGRHFFPAYATQIIDDITGDKTQSFYYTLSIDLIIISSIILSSILVKVINLRTLLFTTGVPALAVLTSVCVYLLLTFLDVISKERQWIPLSMIVIFFILVNLCCTPIPYLILGEILPLSHRSIGSSLSGLILSLFLMIALKITPYLLENINVHGTFTVYGGFVAVSLLLLYFMLPETKNKTLVEIEDYFNNGKYHSYDETDKDIKRRMLI
ncbi:facilitated trehalose transporter Tret1-like [Galleria mellonella]|uniref:Facilitated trehalose transporter Tret1-like n=1 Tax=Galleria mellonella TaxID=7137 RepID=A0A6J1X026_GALME|nr:facilitated trehalose transporter Tret1-like [Galleria mellonella]